MRRHIKSRNFTVDRVCSDPFVQHCIARYAYNLMGHIEMSNDYLWILLRVLPGERQKELGDWLMAKTKKEHSRPRYFVDTEDLVESAGDIWCDVKHGIFRVSRKEFTLRLYAIYRKWYHKVAGRDVSKTLPELKRLQKMFGLDDYEMESICLLYCVQIVLHFRELIPHNRITEFLRIAAVTTGFSLRRVRTLFATKGALLQKGLVLYYDNSGEGYIFQLQPAAVDYLSGLTDVPLKERFIRADHAQRYDLGSFNVAQTTAGIIRALLSSNHNCNILFYGQPGTGKTEFARAVIAAAGRPAYFYQRHERQETRSTNPHKDLVQIRAAVNLISAEGGVLIVDEADSILNTRYFMFGADKMPDKGQLNVFLDQCRAKIIWITNDSSCIEESTLRRFSYSLKFKGFSRIEREHIWNELVQKHSLKRFIPPALIKELASSYPCNAAGIASALDTLKAVLPASSPTSQDIQAALEDLLQRHTEAIGRQPVSSLNRLTDCYDIDALNTDTPPAPVLAALSSFVQFRRDNRRKEGNVNLLFWGKPGTGKTEMAKYLADQLSVELILKRASDLISMWVGQTEVLIREAFEQAGRENAILFIDEADSFFINRQTAQRSWEVSQTNELLTQMENHKGILICCTNLLDHLDHAVLRRFTWKIEFRPLTNDGKIRVFSRFFPEIEVGEDARRQIGTIVNLTPGHIKAVWQKYRFVPAGKILLGTIIAAMENEAQYKGGKSGTIGFRT